MISREPISLKTRFFACTLTPTLKSLDSLFILRPSHKLHFSSPFRVYKPLPSSLFCLLLLHTTPQVVSIKRWWSWSWSKKLCETTLMDLKVAKEDIHDLLSCLLPLHGSKKDRKVGHGAFPRLLGSHGNVRPSARWILDLHRISVMRVYKPHPLFFLLHSTFFIQHDIWFL